MSDAAPRAALQSLALFQPIGLAIAQILAFCAANVGEVGIQDATRSLYLVGLFVTLTWLLLWLPCRGPRRAALVTSLLVFAFWSARPIAHWAAEGLGARVEPVAAAVAAVLAVLVVVAGWRLARAKRDPVGLCRVVDAMSVVSVAVPITTLLLAASHGAGAAVRSASTPADLSDFARRGETRPDIYWIVLDAYGRDDLLAEHFGIERGLGARLADRGFFVAQESRTNYTSTLHALPSVLNYDYIQDLFPAGNYGKAALIGLTKRNRLLRQVSRAGYKTISYDTGIELSQFRHVDEFIRPPAGFEIQGIEFRPNYFERGLIGTTLIDLYLRRSRSLSEYTRHRVRVLHALNDLPRHAHDPEAAFVFAHILSPHEPFVFGRHGEDVSPRDQTYRLNAIFEDPELPEAPGHVGPTYAARYADQARYVGDLVIEAIDEILAAAPDSIIIVQGDHGPYGFSPNIRKARAEILNAYHLPGDGEMELYPSISPVNTGRILMRRYFDEELPLLPDRSYRTHWRDPDSYIALD